jgi:uncharacterized membrane protein YuzA (DUF378 family)
MKQGTKKLIRNVSFWLMAVGAINWALAIWDINLVTMLLGKWSWAVNLTYGLIGASAIAALIEKFD